jgi:hypothetical protein
MLRGPVFFCQALALPQIVTANCATEKGLVRQRSVTAVTEPKNRSGRLPPLLSILAGGKPGHSARRVS